MKTESSPTNCLVKPLYSPSEFAAIIGVHQETVRVWLRDGTIRGVKIKRQWRIPIAAVAYLLLDRVVNNPAHGQT